MSATDLLNFKWEVSPGLGMLNSPLVFFRSFDLLLTVKEHHCGICSKGLSSLDSPIGQFESQTDCFKALDPSALV